MALPSCPIVSKIPGVGVSLHLFEYSAYGMRLPHTVVLVFKDAYFPYTLLDKVPVP